MKIEKRGKYPGVKVHLEPDEVLPFKQLAEDAAKAGKSYAGTPMNYFVIALKMGRKILAVEKECPDLLDKRTPEQIRESLLKDQAKIAKQLAAGIESGAWMKVE